MKLQTIEEVKQYLTFIKGHYESLAIYMRKKGKTKYALQHEGKVKFIELLLDMMEVS